MGSRTPDNFHDPLMGFVLQNDLPFYIENNRYVFVDSIKDADIIPVMVNSDNIDKQLEVLKHKSSHSFVVVMLHTHLSETYSDKTIENIFVGPYKQVTDNIIVVGCGWLNKHPNYLFYDFYLNHCKAYFFDYNRLDLDHHRRSRLWTGNNSSKSYVIPEIKKYYPTRKFLVPNVYRPDSGEYKESVRLLLRHHTSDNECHYSNFQEGIYLLPQEKGLEYAYTEDGAGNIPINNSYYMDTVLSVYVETIGTRKWGSLGVSEKTFNPLIKGHLILPFSGSTFVQSVVNRYGIKFPNWLDTSYDLIEDDYVRKKAYIKTVINLKRKSLPDLTEMLHDSLEIRMHNREQLKSIPYDSLYDKLKERIGL